MFEELDAAIDSLVVDGLDDASLHEFTVQLQARLDRLASLQASALSQWDKRKIWSDNGSLSGPSRLARETGLSLSDSRHLVTRAKQLCSMPLTAGAFSSGSLSTSRVDLLCRAFGTSAEFFSRDESVLLDSVSSLRFFDAAKTVRRWQELVNDEESESRSESLVQQRSASVSRTFEGTVDLKALFDPVNGEIFSKELQVLDDKLFEADWAEAKALYGDDVTVDKLKRTPAQRRCDALVEMAKRSAACPEGSRTPRPLISVVCDRESFGRMCELANGTVISPGQIVPLLSEAQVERIVFDGPSRIIDLGHKRLFTGGLRRALEIRDGHCQHPSGCDVVASKCEGDHDWPYIKDGLTNQENGKLLCPAHNRRKGCGPP